MQKEKSLTQTSEITLQDSITHLINNYFEMAKPLKPSENLYDMVMEQVETPLLQATMEKSQFNQVRAAKMLGVSRGTLRKKLIKYFDDKYCATAEKP